MGKCGDCGCDCHCGKTIKKFIDPNKEPVIVCINCKCVECKEVDESQ